MCGMPHWSTMIWAGPASPAASSRRRPAVAIPGMAFSRKFSEQGGLRARTSTLGRWSGVRRERRPPARNLGAVVDRDVAEVQEDALALGGTQEDEVVLGQHHLRRALQHAAAA